MAFVSLPFLSFLISLVFLIPFVHALPISTSTPIPPLQWINLSHLLQGAASPPPLKDAAVGYDENSRTMIVFGGEASSGVVQSQTYLLDLQTLTWSIPSPPSNLQRTPPARSAAISGGDFAANYRGAFLIAGGKGIDGPLSDVWEYDFNNQFWSEVGLSSSGPSARWGASGGIDIRTVPIQDPVLTGPNNTFYLAGGVDGTHSSPLSDVWRLNISGTLSSNLPDSSFGSWEHLTFPAALPPMIDQAGTVIAQTIVAAGGCNITSASNDSCALSSSYAINVDDLSELSPVGCPAPRLSPTIVPNGNVDSTSFLSQVFMLLGTFNTSLWDDGGGLEHGEVAVLDTNSGTWTRIIPSGDPGSDNKVTFPSPREGASSVMYTSALVGQSRTISADTLVFGGRDSSGTYLSELWLLRAYSATLTSSNATWSGFGNGRLGTGVNANGAGVTVQYLSTCASPIVSDQPATHTGSSVPTSVSPSSSSLLSPTSSSQSSSPRVLLVFNTSVLHKLLAPLSVALIMPTFLLFRLSSPSFNNNPRSLVWQGITALLALVAYALGVVGLVTSFTTVSASTSSVKRSMSSDAVLKTGHGKAGLVLFICLYGVVPLMGFFIACFPHPLEDGAIEKYEKHREASNSIDTAEKLASPHGASASQSVQNFSPPSSPRRRTHSWGPSSWGRSREGRLSSDSESASSAGPPRGFEVVNRHPRIRQTSGSWSAVHASAESAQRTASRSLGQVDWLHRRRSLNAVGELDYILSQARRDQVPSTPGTTDHLLATPSVTVAAVPLHGTPPWSTIVFRGIFQASLLGLSILSLIALWSRAPRSTFGVFLAWTLLYYFALFTFAWSGRPDKSVIAVMITRLRGQPQPLVSATSPSPQPRTAQDEQIPLQGPYVHHRPTYRAAQSSGHDDETLHCDPRSVDTDAFDDEDNRIEDEMSRRDVSIVTVPKRKLWITNPS